MNEAVASSRQLDALRKRLEATFSRIDALKGTDLEVRSDFARYLTILVSGYVETAAAQIMTEHCENHARSTVSNYAGNRLGQLRNLKSEQLLQLVGGFDSAWRAELKKFMAGSRFDALNSVVALRNEIAHGNPVGVTYARVYGYYVEVQQVIKF
ncbi:MAG: hypothetical protein H0V62_02520 [Gammaproteobacteria bacterium]|nr:hypothetical protein [Gammaproteobacteria bacterium]